jgi:hypothetical protein
VALQDVGVVIQLGHKAGEPCIAPEYSPRTSLVLHTNGFHSVTLLYCRCNRVEQAGTRTQQLLRSSLYPATLTDPSTFCTIQMLEQFHILTLQGKLTAYNYYQSLERLTNNTGLSKHYVSAGVC